MAKRLGYGALDRFRLVAALLVIANHTGPLASYSAGADFVLTGIFARIANAFFFMATGYFCFGRLTGDRRGDRAALGRTLAKLGLFYGAGVLLYVPLNVHTGYFDPAKGVLSYAEDIAFNGTFYHLWYLPAAMLGLCIVYALRSALPLPWTLAVAAVLYAAGLLGDSYYGLTAQSGALTSFYDALFHGFDYTRNGLFFAPLYVALGALAARRPVRAGFTGRYAAALLMLSGLWLAEGFALHAAGHPHHLRHDSMYVFMAPAAYVLFRLLLALGGSPHRGLRPVCAWIYLLHPIAIVLLRGIAEQTGTVPVLIGNSLLYFAAVSVLSALLAYAAVRLLGLLGSLRDRRRSPTAPSRAWAEVDLDRLAHNWRALGQLLPAGTRMMAVVKADAYGHGSVRVAKRLYREGARFFAVAAVDEGIALRRGGVRGDVLVLGPTPTHRLPELVRYRLAQTVADADDAERLQAFGKRLDVHIKLDTGMNRLGEPHDRTERVLSMYRHSRLRVKGTFSHFAAADSSAPADAAFTRAQIARFEQAVAQVRAAGLNPGFLHLQSSYGILNYPDLRCDLARPGIALYGLLASEGDKAKARGRLELRPALSLKATVTRVSDVRAGESVGYGRSFVAARDSRIATLSVGYADGLPRELPERGGCVLIRGRRARMVGRACMDQLMVDATDLPDVRPGDTATLIGEDGGETITAEEIAGLTGTIAHEIVCAIGARVARREAPLPASAPAERAAATDPARQDTAPAAALHTFKTLPPRSSKKLV